MNTFLSKHWPKLVFVFFALLMTTSSILDTRNRGNQMTDPQLFNAERAYDLIERYSLEPRPRGSLYHEQVRQGLIQDIQDAGFTAIEMDYRLTREDALSWGTYYGQDIIADSLVRNLLVHIPGTGTSSDAIMFMGHYDSVPMGPGANDNLIAVATMIETLHAINEHNLTFENDLIFFFPDGEEEGLYGARFFALERSPVNSVDPAIVALAGHVKFLVNHESRGTGGTAIMFETTQPNADTIRYFARINRDIYTNSIANFIYSLMPNGTDYSAFSALGVQGINVANIGEGYNYHTQYDRIEELDLSLLEQHIVLEHAVLRELGNEDLDKLYQSTQNAVFFSYLNLGLIHYGEIVAWIAMVLAIVGYVALIQVAGKAQFVQLLKGMAALLLLLVTVVVGLMGVRPLLESLPVIGPRLSSSSYASTQLMFTVYGLATLIYVGVYSLIKKWLRIEALHVAQATLVLYTLLGSLLTVVLFELSFLFMVPALLGLFVWDIALHHAKGQFNGLLFGSITFLFLPLAYPILSLASEALGAAMYDVIAIVLVLLLSVSLPFAIDGLAKFTQPYIRSSLPVGLLIGALVMGVLETVRPEGYSLSTNLAGKASGRSVLFTDDALIWEVNTTQSTAQLMVLDVDAGRFMHTDLIASGFIKDSVTDTYTRATTATFTPNFYTTSVVGSVLTVDVTLSGQDYVEMVVPAQAMMGLTLDENGLTTHVSSTVATTATRIKVFGNATVTITFASTLTSVQLMLTHFDMDAPTVADLSIIRSLVDTYEDAGLRLHQKWVTSEQIALNP